MVRLLLLPTPSGYVQAALTFLPRPAFDVSDTRAGGDADTLRL
jgi:hypothetical protein